MTQRSDRNYNTFLWLQDVQREEASGFTFESCSALMQSAAQRLRPTSKDHTWLKPAQGRVTNTPAVSAAPVEQGTDDAAEAPKEVAADGAAETPAAAAARVLAAAARTVAEQESPRIAQMLGHSFEAIQRHRPLKAEVRKHDSAVRAALDALLTAAAGADGVYELRVVGSSGGALPRSGLQRMCHLQAVANLACGAFWRGYVERDVAGAAQAEHSPAGDAPVDTGGNSTEGEGGSSDRSGAFGANAVWALSEAAGTLDVLATRTDPGEDAEALDAALAATADAIAAAARGGAYDDRATLAAFSRSARSLARAHGRRERAPLRAAVDALAATLPARLPQASESDLMLQLRPFKLAGLDLPDEARDVAARRVEALVENGGAALQEPQPLLATLVLCEVVLETGAASALAREVAARPGWAWPRFAAACIEGAAAVGVPEADVPVAELCDTAMRLTAACVRESWRRGASAEQVASAATELQCAAETTPADLAKELEKRGQRCRAEGWGKERALQELARADAATMAIVPVYGGLLSVRRAVKAAVETEGGGDVDGA